MPPLSTSQIRSVFQTFLGGDPADPSFGKDTDGFELMMYIAASPEHERFILNRHEEKQRYCITDTPSGTFLTYSADKVIGESLRRNGRFEEAAIGRAISWAETLGRSIVKSIFVDVGANIGTHSLHALSAGFSKAVCVEANQDNFRALRVNQILNDVESKCHNVHAAASDYDGVVLMEVSPSNFGDHRVRQIGTNDAVHGEASWLTHNVPAKRLDDIIAEAGHAVDDLGLVWIDTQGHEGQVLSGAPNLIDSNIPVALEFWPYGLQRAGGFELLETALGQRKRIFDLRRTDVDGAPASVTLDTLRSMYEQMRRMESPQNSPHTDLLLL